MADLAVEAEGLVKRFGQTRALDGIGLAVPAGSIHGVLGPNGAGKTTTLRTLLGILDPDSGWRRILGEDKPMRAARQIGYLLEDHRHLRPRDYLREPQSGRAREVQTARARAPTSAQLRPLSRQ